MFVIGPDSTLWGTHVNGLLAGSGIGAFVLLTAGWQLRSAILRRRARRRPLALVLSDAIIAGSNAPRDPHPPPGDARRSDAPGPYATRRIKPVLGNLEKLNDKDEWGFSLHEADKVIFTFVYAGREKALAAHKAMRRTSKDLAFLLQPAALAAAPPDPPPARKPWELDMGLDPVSRSYVRGVGPGV